MDRDERHVSSAGTFSISLALSLAFLTACAGGAAGPPPATVPSLDVERYAGTWYEIASYPIRPQRGCVGTTATYTLRDDGRIDVYNHCYRNSFEGRERSVRAIAWVPDEERPGELRVRFFRLFSGDYWVVDLDDEYRTAVVSDPERSTLWILHRDPCMDEDAWRAQTAALVARGFDMAPLNVTLQRDESGQECRVPPVTP